MEETILWFESCEGGLAVTSGDAHGGVLEIPSEHEGEPVVAIGAGAFKKKSFSSVVIAGTLKTVGEGAFAGCVVDEVRIGDLASWCGIEFADAGACPLNGARRLYVGGKRTFLIDVPQGVESIGAFAFSGYRGYFGLTLPESLSSVGKDAFMGCRNMLEVRNLSPLVIEKGSEENGCAALYAREVYGPQEDARGLISASRDGFMFVDDGETLRLIGYEGKRKTLVLPSPEGRRYEVCDDAFYECAGITGVTIPDSVTRIGKEAFAFCESVGRLKIGDGVTVIDDRAFAGCFGLRNVDFGKGLVFIGREAFSSCYSLRHIELPAGLKHVGENAFGGNEGLESVTVPDSVSFMGYYAFGYSARLFYLGDEYEWDRVMCPIYDGSDYHYDGFRSYLEEPKNHGSINRGLYGPGKTCFYRDRKPENVRPIFSHYFRNGEPLIYHMYYWHYGDNGKPVIW